MTFTIGIKPNGIIIVLYSDLEKSPSTNIKTQSEQIELLYELESPNDIYDEAMVIDDVSGCVERRNLNPQVPKGLQLVIQPKNETIAYGSAAPEWEPAIAAGWLDTGDSLDDVLGGSPVYTVLEKGTDNEVADVSAKSPATFDVAVEGITSKKYDLRFQLGTLIITKKELTVSVEGETITEGDSPSKTVAYAGFASGESQSDLDTQPTIAYYDSDGQVVADVAAAEPGVYEARPGGGVSDNYSFKYVSGELTIESASPPATKIELTATADDESVSEGETPTGAIIYTGFEEGDDEGDLETPPVVNYYTQQEELVDDITAAEPGTYIARPGGGNDNQYTFIYVDGTLTITQADGGEV